MEYIKIVIDTKGGDKGPEEMIRGAALALQQHDALAVVLVGDEKEMAQRCSQLNMPMDRVELVDAPGAVTNYDNAAEALYHKQDSSMMIALKTLAERSDLSGLLCAGNTGILMAGAMRYLSGKNRVRPALAALLPAQTGDFTCLVDTGATIDCTPSMLVHFAHLGADMMKNMYGIENPRIGLLSNGAEPTKGNKLVKETHQLLAEDATLHFVGNIEGNTALSGGCDVLVCDGFAGNQVLKVTEGTATRIITDIVKYAKKTGSGEIMKLVGHLMAVYDISALGGGIILGIEKPIIKIRGNSGGETIVNTSRMLLNMAQNKSVFNKEENKIG